ncbi:hypothetical protein ES705_11121 [subsurface metagenome]
MVRGRSTTVIGVRVPDSVSARIRDLASKQGLTISEWCKAVLTRAAGPRTRQPPARLPRPVTSIGLARLPHSVALTFLARLCSPVAFSFLARFSPEKPVYTIAQSLRTSQQGDTHLKRGLVTITLALHSDSRCLDSGLNTAAPCLTGVYTMG